MSREQLKRDEVRIRQLKDAFGCAFVSSHLLPDLSVTRSPLMWADAIDSFASFTSAQSTNFVRLLIVIYKTERDNDTPCQSK
jgi:hypothetical protein